MAGPKLRIDYTADDATVYRMSVPTWQQTFTGDPTATSVVTAPKGLRRRHRFIRGNTTGREYRVTVGDPTSVVWTTAKGAAVAVAPTIPGAPDSAFTYGGRVGERDLIRD